LCSNIIPILPRSGIGDSTPASSTSRSKLVLMARPREIRLAAVLDALIAATDNEVGRLRAIIEQDQNPHEARFQALVCLAQLSSNMVSLLADRKVEIG
jgi:hypothetical protein